MPVHQIIWYNFSTAYTFYSDSEYSIIYDILLEKLSNAEIKNAALSIVLQAENSSIRTILYIGLRNSTGLSGIVTVCKLQLFFCYMYNAIYIRYIRRMYFILHIVTGRHFKNLYVYVHGYSVCIPHGNYHAHFLYDSILNGTYGSKISVLQIM